MNICALLVWKRYDTRYVEVRSDYRRFFEYISNHIAQKMDELTITSRENKKEHVDNIRRTAIEYERKINSGICPKCNDRLVLRTGKYGKFYGCSNYPKCKFTKQI